MYFQTELSELTSNSEVGGIYYDMDNLLYREVFV